MTEIHNVRRSRSRSCQRLAQDSLHKREVHGVDDHGGLRSDPRMEEGLSRGWIIRFALLAVDLLKMVIQATEDAVLVDPEVLGDRRNVDGYENPLTTVRRLLELRSRPCVSRRSRNSSKSVGGLLSLELTAPATTIARSPPTYWLRRKARAVAPLPLARRARAPRASGSRRSPEFRGRARRSREPPP
jgi:hypothetical protein